MLHEREPMTLGLREQKKVRTRAAIQHHAMRLFRDQGYDATTIDQIAQAADVSATTFFRYFPTKEHLVLANDFGPRVIAAFLDAPPEADPVAAMRHAMRSVITRMTPEEISDQRERQALTFAVPQLRGLVLDSFVQNLGAITDAVAQRWGRDRDDVTVRALAGALIGVMLAGTSYWSENPETDVVVWMDEALAALEAGVLRATE
ncbi:MAG: TetR family transcriptional regulator [Candidatus Nanopelagicales bacterium]